MHCGSILRSTLVPFTNAKCLHLLLLPGFNNSWLTYTMYMCNTPCPSYLYTVAFTGAPWTRSYMRRVMLMLIMTLLSTGCSSGCLVGKVRLSVIFTQYLVVSTCLYEVWLVKTSCDVWYCRQNSQGLKFDEIKLSFITHGINNIISAEIKPVLCLIILQAIAYPMCSNYPSVMTVLFSQTKTKQIHCLPPLLPYFT